jgi:hypothetical protein
MLGVSLFAAGVICAFAPSVIDVLGVWVGVLAGVAMLFGLIWATARWVFGIDLAKRGSAAIAKLTKEGKAAEATAVLRTIDPQVDATFRRASHA